MLQFLSKTQQRNWFVISYGVMAQPPPREGRLGHHSRDSCSNCHEDHQKTVTDKQEECFWVHIVAFDPEGALGHVNQEPKWTNARKRHRLEPRIDYKNKQRDWERVWRSLAVTQLEDFERSRHQLAGYWGQKEILQYVTKTAWMWVWRSSSAGWECEVWGADQAGAGGLQLTTPRLHTFRPIDIQLWQNQNETWNFWNLNQKIAHWNSDQSLVENVLYLDLVIESQ